MSILLPYTALALAPSAAAHSSPERAARASCPQGAPLATMHLEPTLGSSHSLFYLKEEAGTQ